MICLGVLFVLAVLAYSTLYFGFVQGQEFAADSFSRRQFSFYEIPLIRLQVTPIDRQDVTNDLELYLIAQKLVVDLKKPPAAKRWDLVIAERGLVPEARRLVSQGDARILCEYLDASDDKGNRIWLDWSKQHLEAAKVVWPAVGKVAGQELYAFAPELLVLARDTSDPKQVQAELDSYLAEKYLAFGNMQQQLGNHEAAIEVFTEVLVHSPSRVEAFLGRAKSLTSLGKAQKASTDLAQAQQLQGRR